MRWIETPDQAAIDGAVAWVVPPSGAPAALPAPRPEDLAHAARRADPARRAATLERRLLLRLLAAHTLGVEAQAVAVNQPPTGAPLVVAPRPLHGALAARDGWTLVAVASHSIGVDVERVEPGAHRPLDLLHSDMATRLRDVDDAAFAQAWAATEAHLKRTGEGLAGLGAVQVDGGLAWGSDLASAIVVQVRADMVFACATPAKERG